MHRTGDSMGFHIDRDQLAVLVSYPLHDFGPRNDCRPRSEGSNMKASYGFGPFTWEPLPYFAEAFGLALEWFKQPSDATR